MSQTLARVRLLIAAGEIRISDHGYDELSADDLTVDELVRGAQAAEVIEDYPTFAKGPCVLVLQRDAADRPVHVVWGMRPAMTARRC